MPGHSIFHDVGTAHCGTNWSAMVGDDSSRKCPNCNQVVFGLDGLPESEAENLIAQGRELQSEQVRLYRRRDGTFILSNKICLSRKLLCNRAIQFSLIGIGCGISMITYIGSLQIWMSSFGLWLELLGMIWMLWESSKAPKFRRVLRIGSAVGFLLLQILTTIRCWAISDFGINSLLAGSLFGLSILAIAIWKPPFFGGNN